MCVEFLFCKFVCLFFHQNHSIYIFILACKSMRFTNIYFYVLLDTNSIDLVQILFSHFFTHFFHLSTLLNTESEFL